MDSETDNSNDSVQEDEFIPEGLKPDAIRYKAKLKPIILQRVTSSKFKEASRGIEAQLIEEQFEIHEDDVNLDNQIAKIAKKVSSKVNLNVDCLKFQKTPFLSKDVSRISNVSDNSGDQDIIDMELIAQKKAIEHYDFDEFNDMKNK